MDEINKKVEPVVEIDPIAAKDAEIARLSEERDNYKTVALKRLGKLPGDAEFIDKDGSGMSVAEQVRIELLNREIASTEKAKQTDIARITKENSELRLALKNRPSASIGGGSGESLEVKDNILSEQQIAVLRAKAERLKVKDINAFLETAKANLSKNR
jgi:uncharacterized small protein (DUF1192 family)